MLRKMEIKFDPETGNLLNQAELLQSGMTQETLDRFITFNRRALDGKPARLYVQRQHDTRDQVLRQAKENKDQLTTGMVSFVQAVVSGKVDSKVLEERESICRQCDATDDKGERLFREIDGKVYCGEPRLRRILRSEAKSGCGCKLTTKWVFQKSRCPLGKW